MKHFKSFIFILAVLAISPNMANAQLLKDVLGKLGSSDTKSTVGSIVEGLLTSSKLEVKDLAGTWTSNDPAVCFQGDNFLKKAGGAVASATVEKELAKYYSKYGLNGAELAIDNQGEFQLKFKKLTLKGTVEKYEGQDGVFLFKFQAFGKINLGEMKTYVQKTSNSMDVMFDATKLMAIINAVAKYSGISIAKTLSSLLSSYDGLCVGFAMDKTGNAPVSKNGQTVDNETDNTSTSTTSSKIGSALESILKGNK